MLRDRKKPPFPYLIALTEGAIVMAIELIAGHEISLFLGGGLQVWSTVLAVTLAGLCAGYLMGALRKPSKPDLIGWLLLLPVAWVAVVGRSEILETIAGGNGAFHILAVCMGFLFPPMVALGQVLPIALKLFPSYSPGRLFAISTWSGVGTAFLLGFVLFRHFHPPLLLTVMGLFASGIGCILAFDMRNRILLGGLGLVTGIMTLLPGKEVVVVWSSENMFGQVEVKDDSSTRMRSLNYNGLPQTAVNLDNGCSALSYVNEISVLGSAYPSGSRSLVLGLGGGTVFKELRELGHQVEACEWNPDIAAAAVEVFGVDRSLIHVDDARHHIRMLNENYHFIVLDCFFGENPPWHVLTIETLKELKGHMQPGGMLVVYFPSGIGLEDTGTGKMVSTMVTAGFHVAKIGMPVGERAGQLFAATLRPFSYETYTPFRLTRCAEYTGIGLRIPFQIIKNSSIHSPFDDDHPVLERLHRSH